MNLNWKLDLKLFGAGISLCVLLATSLVSFALPQGATKKKIEFTSEVLPILKAHCYECHAGEKNAGGLRLDTRASAFKGGVSGATIILGNPVKSLLLERVLGHGGKPRMPIGFAPLSEAQNATVKLWIEQGADWPDASRAKKHWAYINPVRPAIPVVKNRDWIRNPIDSFVLNRIEKAGFTGLSELTKDADGIWRGTAVHAGKPVSVALDFKGNVVAK